MGFHKSQVFFYLLSAFIIGVFLASFFSFSSSSVLILVLISVGAITLSGMSNRPVILVSFLVLAFAIGIIRFNFFSAGGGSAFGGNSKDNLISLAGQLGQKVTLEGYVASEPVLDANKLRFAFKSGNEKILVTAAAFPKRMFGDQLLVEGKIEEPKNFTDFDYITYLKKDGIRVTMFYPVIEDRKVDLARKDDISVSIYKNIFSVKNKFENSINLSLPEPNASFINGILLGSRQNLPQNLKDAFSKTGTTHILAISGYNIMIISETVLLGLIWFFKRRTAFWISVGVIILFVILTGSSASVVRAAVMGLLLSFAQGYGRLYDQKNSIILAGGAMIWLNPFVLVFDIGFQLSFAAVLGIIYLYPWIDHKLYKIPKLGGLKELILMTFSAQASVAPLLIYYFGGLSLISLPANILILSFLPYAMLSGFIAGLAGMIFIPLGQGIGYIAWAITTYQINIVKFFASL